MGVVRAEIQKVEEIYKLLWSAVANKQPIEANYQGRHRLFCPHRLGRNREGQLRVLCYQYGGESRSGLDRLDSSANWRCVALEKLSRVRLVEGDWRTAPNRNSSRGSSCFQQRRNRLSAAMRPDRCTQVTKYRSPLHLRGARDGK
jgi:hypothetical protein